MREAVEADLHAAFQLYMRAVPAEHRAQLAMTLDEWRSLRSRRWLGRQALELVAECDGRVVGVMRCDPGSGQLELLVDPETAEAASDALLDAAVEVIHADQVITLSEAGAPQAATLERRGLAKQQELTLLCRRTLKPLTEAAPVPVNARLA